MKKLIIAAAAASLMALALPAAAETYVNLGYTNVDAGSGVNLGAATGRFGWKSPSWYGFEAEASGGVNGDTISGVKIKLNSQFAAYGVAHLPVSDTADLFARVGYGTTDIKGSAGGFTAGGSDQSWNYGVGGNLFFAGDNGVRADYTYSDFDKGGHANVWSISYVRRFK